MWILVACAPPRGLPPPEPPVPPDGGPPYAEVVAAIEAHRADLSVGGVSHDEARDAITDAFDVLVPRWFGTGWDFYGVTREPGPGDIACGHFVGAVLRDAGFRVDRYAVGRLPSESILGMFAAPSERLRFRNQTPDAIVLRLKDAPDGPYGAGFDFHAGLLLKSGDTLRFCHASPFEDAVVCEDPLTSPAFPSKYTVFGSFVTDAAVDAWLAGTPIPTP